MATFKETQARFGPYFFGVGEAGGGAPAPSSPSGFANAPSITNSTPTTIGGFLSQGLGFGPNSGFAGKATTTGANLGLNIGLNALGIPGLAMTGPINAMLSLSQLAHRMGLQGQDTSGMMGLTQGNIDAALGVAQGSGPHVSQNITQGTGLTAGQLASLANAARGIDAGLITGQNANPDPNANPDAGLVAAGAGPSGPTSDGGNTGIGLGDAGIGIGLGDAYHKGGPVNKSGSARLLKKEYVVNPKAAQLHRTLLEAINKGASRAELAAMMKAGR